MAAKKAVRRARPGSASAATASVTENGRPRKTARGLKSTRAVKAGKVKITGQRAVSAARARGFNEKGRNPSVNPNWRSRVISQAAKTSMRSGGQSLPGRMGYAMKRTGAVRLAQG